MYAIAYTSIMKFEIFRTAEFTEWYEGLDAKTKWMIAARLERIKNEGHFGTVNRFEGLTELKWKSGLRVYTVELRPRLIVLYGGNKNGQEKDIRRAQKIRREIK